MTVIESIRKFRLWKLWPSGLTYDKQSHTIIWNPVRKWLKLRGFSIRREWKFEARDLWIGIFWDSDYYWRQGENGPLGQQGHFHIYVCVLPTLPLHFTITRLR